MRSAEAMWAVREAVAALIGADDPSRIILTQNATSALNIAIFGLIREPCHVLISDLEHNSVVRPIEELVKRVGIHYDVFKTSGDIEQNIMNAIRSDTRYIVSTLASNVSGRIVPLDILSRVRQRHGLRVIVDASQVAGHLPIDVGQFPIDALCAPGHKGLYGYMGCGFAFFDKSADVYPHSFGGSGSHSFLPTMPEEYPDRLEAGTLPFYSLLSMGYGIAYIQSMGLESVGDKIERLASGLREGLLSITGIELIGEPRLGILSFRHVDMTPDAVCEYLKQRGIFTRSGLHCAPLAHKTYHTEKEGLVRISLSYENHEWQMRRVRDVIWNMTREIK